MALHCPECGFVNGDGANFCQKCGTHLTHDTSAEPTTASYKIGETGEFVPVEFSDDATLVIRAGGGRTGESFAIAGERMTVGRRPDSDIFLDDVTVSRDHALLIQRGNEWYLDDCGSLNGTYVNRTRIESQRLYDGDELQIGKYKLTFLSR